MSRNVFDDRIVGVLEQIISESEGPTYVADPSADVVEALVDALSMVEEPPEIRVLAHESALKEVFEDFLVASEAADHLDSGALTLRVAADSTGNTTITSEDGVTTVVNAGTRVGGLRTDDEQLIEAALSEMEERWSGADEYSLRTPAMTDIREQLVSDLEPDVEADFTGMLDSLETARGDGSDLDEVTVSLLAAAKNEALLYDISRWGEDTGVASKATFSRTKSSLEDAGLIDTEKVPIEVGRPRLRLTLADERLEDASPDQIAAAAQTVLN